MPDLLCDLLSAQFHLLSSFPSRSGATITHVSFSWRLSERLCIWLRVYISCPCKCGTEQRAAEGALRREFKGLNALYSFLVQEFLLQYLCQVLIRLSMNNFHNGKFAKEINWGLFQHRDLSL